MYTHFFNLTHNPFSIAPDPRFLFMSERHREALAHLLYGISGGGGFVLLTGEIGAGKTTVCRCFLEQIPENCQVGYIFNPKLTVHELLKSICDEFDIRYQHGENDPASIKVYVDALNTFLLAAHAEGKHNVLIIDEAQSLSAEVLEQLRLLTNLETNERKLLQIILIGQPELRTLLEKPELRQLAQRVIARYHLDSLSVAETSLYVSHRLAVAGNASAAPFPSGLMKSIHALTQGVPRRINLLCDRALLGAYAEGKPTVTRRILYKAASEVFSIATPLALPPSAWRYTLVGLAAGIFLSVALMLKLHTIPAPVAIAPPPANNMAVAPKIVVPPHPAINDLAAAKNKSGAMTMTAAYIPYHWNETVTGTALDPEPTYRLMARLWGMSLPEGDPCTAIQQTALRCYESNKGFAEIRELQRPALLSLRDPENHTYYALLTGLTETQASMMIGQQTYTVNLVDLARHFPGDFVTFWRVPPGYRDKVRPGDQGKDVDWIATQLARLNGTALPRGQQTFDTPLIRQIREFQSVAGLQADGVIGPKTYMQLSHATDKREPHLHDKLPLAQTSLQ